MEKLLGRNNFPLPFKIILAGLRIKLTEIDYRREKKKYNYMHPKSQS